MYDYVKELEGKVALPERANCTLLQFARRIRLCIEREEQRANPDTVLIALLCDAARFGCELLEAQQTDSPVGWSASETEQRANCDMDELERDTVPPVDRTARVMTDGSPETPDHREINPVTGMQKGYVVLSAEERAKGFVKPVRKVYVHKVCGAHTWMSQELAETYARDPTFYIGTFCSQCKAHRPLNEFVWEGTEEVLGT